MSLSSRTASWRTGLLLSLLSLPWIALLAWLTHRSWFMTDDAFISFRYAANLIEGNGLTFNPGERVEGYTNFLWVLELAVIWAAAGIPPEDAAQWLSVGYTAATLGVMAWWAARLPGVTHRGLAWWMALGLVCGSATFAVWTSGGGLETRQFTFFTLLAAALVTTRPGSRRALAAASLSLALASLTRPEGPLIAACCFGWWAAQQIASTRGAAHGDRAKRILERLDWRGLLWLTLPFAAIVGAHFLWRYSYYGEWLPNTYYAKDVRPWWEAGWRYLGAASLETGLHLLLPLSLVALPAEWRSGRNLASALPAVCVALHMVYLARIGGDLFEYRPMDFYWPLLAVPASNGLLRLSAGALEWARRRKIRARLPSGPVLAVALFVPTLFHAGALQYALFAQPETPVTIELTRENAGWLFAAPGMPALAALSNALRERIEPQGVRRRFRVIGADADGWIRTWRPYENAPRGIIPADAAMLVGFIGVISYYLPDLTVIDRYGLTDWTIARNPVASPNSARLIAHDRRPAPGYLDERGVNFDVRPPAGSMEDALEAGAYAVQAGPELWMPFDAPSLQWVEERFDAFSYDREADARLEETLRGARLLSEGRYDVYLLADEKALLYVKEAPCAGDDLARFFLHVIPSNPDDLPEARRAQEFDNRDFWLREARVGAVRRCAATRSLPDYPIASIRTGQFAGDERIWEMETLPPAPDDSAEADALLEETMRSARLLSEGRYDVYLLTEERALLYAKETPCSGDDLARFFLHVIPSNPDDLPEARRAQEFDNLDFYLREARVGGARRCAAMRSLPDYPIASIRTGQFAGDERIWEAEIPLP